MIFSANLLVFGDIHTGPDFKHNNHNQDHRGEGADDDTNNQGHCWGHSSFRFDLRLFFMLCFSCLKVLIFFNVILLVITFNRTLLVWSVPDRLPMRWRDVWKF